MSFGKKLPKRIDDEEEEELKTFRLSEFIIFNLILHIVFKKVFFKRVTLKLKTVFVSIMNAYIYI